MILVYENAGAPEIQLSWHMLGSQYFVTTA
jgi:hypothetical protein